MLGLVCLAVAAIVLAEELGSLSVDWGDVGPLGIVAAGAVLVLFGLVGLLSLAPQRPQPAAGSPEPVAVARPGLRRSQRRMCGANDRLRW